MAHHSWSYPPQWGVRATGAGSICHITEQEEACFCAAPSLCNAVQDTTQGTVLPDARSDLPSSVNVIETHAYLKTCVQASLINEATLHCVQAAVRIIYVHMTNYSRAGGTAEDLTEDHKA